MRFCTGCGKASGADAVITAHHQDDVLETIILILLRGTGRRGLSSLKSPPILL
jgi:tRNA(Ile)-lysidine synthase TilS/MesJ